jgi:alpha-2-macroglobulin
MSLISLLLSLLLAMAQAPLVQQADAAYAEKSFARAHALYEQASQLELTADERRWVELRLADTSWRSDSAAPNPDPTKLNAARAALEEIIRKAGDDHDRIWAEAQEALGDLHWLHPRMRNRDGAQRHYTAALGWWAGSRDLPLARKRYLDIVWRMARWNAGQDDMPQFVPRDVLLNVLQIAERPADRARAHFLLAQQFGSEGRPESIERAFEHYEAVLREGKATPYYDDALYHYASRLMHGGEVIVLEDGRTTTVPNFAKALELLRRLTSEFKSGESPWLTQAGQLIKQIVDPSITVAVGQTFLPDSEQEVALSWRNVKSVQLTIAAIDLTRDSTNTTLEWIESIALTKRVRQWTIETSDAGDHVPGHQRVRITPKLETGAYVIEASSGTQRSRQLLLVTDAHVLVHHTGKRVDAFVSHVVTGEPIAGAQVTLWMQSNNDPRRFLKQTRETNASGIAEIEIPREAAGSFWIAAAKGARQAFHPFYGYRGYQSDDLQWRLYAFTDRPAYRPNETVHWKLIARTRRGDDWQTPAGTTLDYEIFNPRYERVATGKATLNAFGSFWAELPLTPSMTLGAYTIQFKSGIVGLGGATLFRLEEYKLPEFRVSVSTPEGKQYRSGERIEATINAEYYFGGPVANATVQVVIRERPFHRWWHPWRSAYSWYFPPPPPSHGGNVLREETLRTDASGRASVVIDTPRDRGDLIYTIEARVTDASRREVTGSGEVKVTRQRYSMMATPEHFLHRPGDKVAVNFKALDANDKPVQVSGTVTVTRRVWSAATELPLPRRRPQPPPSFKDEVVLTQKLATDKDGEARFTFTPDRDGYYLIRWASDDRRASDLVTAETAVWVTRTASTEIGYRGSDLEIIIDKEAFRAGERAPVLIATPSSGRWIVITTTANDILETQVLKMDGTVKLIHVPLDQKHVPNFFLTASSVFDRVISTQTKSIVVPPVEHFLDVEVKSDREEYEPRQKGTVTITTRDTDGKPVAAEVALSVSDESVAAIQEDLAADPRRFFFGEQRYQTLNVSGSLHGQRYVRLVEEDGRLMDERYAEELRREKKEQDESLGMVGQRRDMAAMAVAPPPPPSAPPMPSPVAEAITVTASAPELAKGAATGNVATQAAEITVRSDFRSTAFWKPDIITGADGTATVTVDYPEALTTWRATARAATQGTQFGMGSSTARTSMPLIVRLQGPRFFVVGDRATVSAVINNNTDAAMRVAPSIEIEGLALADPKAAEVDVPAHGETRVDWTVVAETQGTAKIRVTGRGATRGDAMERTFPVFEHGIDKLIARSGRMRADETIVKLDLPAQRRATDLVVHLQPNLAVSMLDALPYLIEFPYGCTEQTMSRFLPAAVVAKALAAFGNDVPVPKNLDAVTRASMARLYDFQHPTGAWGWWKEGMDDPFMTAYVIWGFSIARDADLRVRTDAVNRAVEWLDDQLIGLNAHDRAWALHALAAWRRGKPSEDERRAFDKTYEDRERLSAYSRALLALAAHDFGDAERAKVLVRNLEDGVRIDRTPDQSVLVRGGSSTAETMPTAFWGSADRFWWRWWEGPVETTSFALRAMTRIDPSNKLIEPAMNWLVRNRRGSRWSNTRDTAIAILTLTERGLPVSRDRVPYELLVNGKAVSSGTIDPLKSAKISVDPALVKDANEITIRSRVRLFFAAEARFVSLEEPVKAAGNELFVRRDYFRLVARPTLLKGVEYDRVPLRDGESVASGERIEVLITVETKNDYEYLIFEDLKPGGFEAVELRSGEPLYATEQRASSVLRETAPGVRRAPESDQTGRTQWVYQELRDRNVALFIDKLPQGTWQISYPLRAEVPGSYHALPVIGHAFYVPDVRGNGEEVRVRVDE